MNEIIAQLDVIDLSRFGPGATTTIRVTVIVMVAWIVIGILQRLIRLFRERLSSRLGDPEQVKRAQTLGRVIRYIVGVVVSLIAGMLILAELGISVAPILGAAGVVGVAVGFGAQSLVKDFFNGFFILLENQIRQGDVVNIAGIGGFVEEITLRFVRLRDYDGNVHYIPNGLITTVTNMSRGFAQAVLDVGIAYREDIDEAFAVMKEVAAEMRADPQLANRMLDDLEVAGVERWDDSAVVLRARLKTAPLEQWTIKRTFFWRLKKAFDARGIEIPYPHLTVYAGEAKDGTSPPFRLVRGGASTASSPRTAPRERK